MTNDCEWLTARMFFPMMACHTFHCRHRLALFIFIVAKKFLIDFGRHLHHFPGNIFLRFCIAGKIQVMTCAVSRRCMAETAFDTQRIFEVSHYFTQLIITNIFRQDLQICISRILGGSVAAMPMTTNRPIITATNIFLFKNISWNLNTI